MYPKRWLSAIPLVNKLSTPTGRFWFRAPRYQTVLFSQKLTPSQLRLLLRLYAAIQDPQHKGAISVPILAFDLQVSERTIYRGLNVLGQLGEIQIYSRPGRVNTYHLARPFRSPRQPLTSRCQGSGPSYMQEEVNREKKARRWPEPHQSSVCIRPLDTSPDLVCSLCQANGLLPDGSHCECSMGAYLKHRSS